MPRFFVKNNDIKDDFIDITGDNVNHIANALRYKVGDTILLCSEDGINYDCTICEISKTNIKTKINNSCNNNSELKININLYQAIAKGEKMDTIIQKATELGITNIYPVETQNTIVKLKDNATSKIERWNKIAREAAEQSERGSIPTVFEPIKFSSALKLAKDQGEVCVCYGREKDLNIKEYLKNISLENTNIISFFIGPEGGFSKEEIMLVDSLDIITISLGNSILRTETASLMFLSIIKYILL